VSLIQVSNHGPLLLATNYWDSDLALAGKVFVSVNAGAIRVLLPPARYGDLAEMQVAKECVLSRGRPSAELMMLDGWHMVVDEVIEIMFDDRSDSPYALHLTPESFDLLPAEPAPGREWICTVWTAKDGKPYKGLELICHWRRVPRIPCLKSWSAK
jgi:hypothetical protein